MPEQLAFKISSALKNIIGKELITDDNIAIFELVKNAYDAHSKKVEIVFENIRDEKTKDKARILIRDDGDGMSFNDLKTKWLVVGYSEKKELEEQLKEKDFRDKIGSKRIFAGAKGIGRFSCDRLGKRLKLYTKKKVEDKINVLGIDWTKFEENSKAEFQTINVEYETQKLIDKKIAPCGLSNGTILEITSLNSSWNQDKLIKLRRHLQRLINPAQVGEPQDFTIWLEAKEYDDKENALKEDHETINGPVHNVVFEKLGIKTTHISSYIDENGEKITTELFDKDRFIFRLVEKNEYPTLANIKVKLFYLNPPAKTTFTKLMGIHAVRYGSIFLYKNGFKISPYGDEGDDWLGLDRRKAQGVRRYLSNRELIGRIELNGYQPHFVEVSSRDGGVVKTQEFTALTNEFFMEKVLKRLERYVVEGLAWDNPSSLKGPKDPEEIKRDSLKIIDQIVGQVRDENKELEFNKELLDIYAEKQIETTPELIKNVEHLKNFVKTDEEKEYIDRQAKVINNAFKEFLAKHDELKEELEQREKQVAFLQRTTDQDKLEIMGLQHHIRNATHLINTYLKRLKEQMANEKSVSSEYVSDIVEKISLQTLTISSIALYATHATFDVRPEKAKRDLISFIREYIENAYIVFNRERLDFENTSINVKVDQWSTFTYEFNPLDFIIIIDNLISNSRKAKAHRIDIEMNKKSENELEIKFRDDGKGIPAKNLDKLFTFGFSTTSGGTGIGLYQIRKIITKYGSISINSTLQSGAEFIITVMR